MTRLLLCTLIFSCILLGACGPKKQLSYEESLMLEARQDCEKDATEMTDPPHNSSGWQWDTYFRMCMKTRYGYDREDLKDLWF